MPLMTCQKDGKPGWKFGSSGRCYTFTKGNRQSEQVALSKAIKQAAAIKASQARAGGPQT